MSFEFHPIANCFPLIEGREFEELVQDVRTNGIHEPVILHDGMILDGRNRYRASQIAGVDCPTVTYDGVDPVGFVVSLNLRRRHLSEGQRGWVAAQIARLGQGRPSEDKAANLPVMPTQTQAAEMLNVSERTVRNAAVVRDNAVPELQQKVAKGEVAPSTAADVARLPEPEQREIVAKGEKEILEAAKRIRSEKAEARRAELVELAATKAEMPDGKFETIVIDPPWPMQKIERDVRPNQVAFEYPTMSEDELRIFGDKVNEASADDCHMFMWTTHKFLPMALRLLESWGFRYVMTMVWHKPGGFQPIGLPQYNCEFCLYARKGSPTFAETKAFNACFEAPRREHSRKPDEFYDLIRRVTAGPRIDIFSREPREGFSQFGNEADLFAGAAA